MSSDFKCLFFFFLKKAIILFSLSCLFNCKRESRFIDEFQMIKKPTINTFAESISAKKEKKYGVINDSLSI